MKVAQSCPALCNPMDYTIHGILQARILECVVFPFSRGSSQPRDWTHISYIAGRFFTDWATTKAHEKYLIFINSIIFFSKIVLYSTDCSFSFHLIELELIFQISMTHQILFSLLPPLLPFHTHLIAKAIVER